MTSQWASVILSAIGILLTIITVYMGIRKSAKENAAAQAKIESEQAAHNARMEERIDELTREVRKHNNFAERMPVLEEQIKVANHRIADLEEKMK